MVSVNDILNEKEQLARSRVCLALDVQDPSEAVELARDLSHLVGSFKVGKTLHLAAGNKGVSIVDEIYKGSPGAMPNVFLDLKLHDTPDQVYGAAMQSAVPGVYMFNVHVGGGEKMCKKAVEGAYEASQKANIARPKVIGVTVLTSLADEDLRAEGLDVTYDALVKRRTELAKNWGLDGIVCPASKAGALEKEFGPWCYVTPGIKYAGVHNAGQKQLDTPDAAVQACTSSILIIGTAITGTKDKPKAANERRATAYEILKSMAQYL
jgi:orotidine-5'-phosphate decarboxylase